MNAGAAEKLRITSAGLVGIGTNVLAASSKLTLFEESGNGQTLEIIAKNAGGVGSQPGIKFTANNGDNIGGIYGDVNSDSLKIQTGGTERLSITSDGIITTPLQPSFSCYKNGNFLFTSNTNTTIKPWTEQHDTHSDFNATTGVFTAPVA